jgi:uncharacterized membrane protein (DUF485 family)
MTMQRITGRDDDEALRAPDGGGAAVTADLFLAEPRVGAGVSVPTMEIATALTFAMAGAAAIWDSARIGAGWGGDGPQSGYFPFWIGVLLVLAAAAQLIAAARTRGGEPRGRDEPMFLTWEQARTVATVFVPTVLYVAAIPFAGIYVASAVLVAWFMARLGGFALSRAVPAGVATSVITFVVFEIWFLVALPKGPVEELLGF